MNRPTLPRPLDHLVVAAWDFDGLAALYRRMGFQVGARNQHPWGTQNHIIQFNTTFLELIGLGQASDAGPIYPKPRQYSFGGFIAQFLQHTQGLAMLALRTADAHADAAAFAALGIGAFDTFDFGRKAICPDGSAADVAFRLAFAQAPLISDAGFFTCQHHHPENFWNVAYQTHANTAQSIKSVVMLAEHPADHAEFFTCLTGQRAVLATSMGIEIDTGFGLIEVLTPLAGHFRYGIPHGPDPVVSPHFVAIRIGVAQPTALQAILEQSATPFARKDAMTIVSAQNACGVAIIFEPA